MESEVPSTYSGLAVLILDDNQENREASADLFASENARPVEADSAGAAERELIAHPGIDVVSLDVSLRGGGHDREGAALAVKLRDAYPELPIIGYSEYFNEAQLSTEERDAFTEYFPRGGSMEDIDVYINHCLDAGLQFRRRRREAFHAQIEELAAAGRLEEREYSVLRSFTPSPDEELSIERALIDAGYQIEVVLPRPPKSLKRVPRRPFVVWVRKVEDDEVEDYEAEVFGQPALYGMGSTPQNAIQNLLEVFWLFAEELAESDEQELVGPALSLAHFFDHILIN